MRPLGVFLLVAGVVLALTLAGIAIYFSMTTSEAPLPTADPDDPSNLVIEVTEYPVPDEEYFVQKQVEFVYGSWWPTVEFLKKHRELHLRPKEEGSLMWSPGGMHQTTQLPVPPKLKTIRIHDHLPLCGFRQKDPSSVCNSMAQVCFAGTAHMAPDIPIEWSPIWLDRHRFHWPAACLAESNTLPPEAPIPMDMSDKVPNDDHHFLMAHSRLNTPDNGTVLVPLKSFSDHLGLQVGPHDDIPWDLKDTRMVFRGSVTGCDLKTPSGQRWAFMKMWYGKRADMDIAFSKYFPWQWMPEADAFSAPVMSREEQYKCKFLLCLEGQDTSSSFHWGLASNCCPIHVYPFKWLSWRFGLQPEPWVHFVPVKRDGSNLEKVWEWCLKNQDKCKQIAINGKNYSERYASEDTQKKVFKHMAEFYPTEELKALISHRTDLPDNRESPMS